MTFRQKFKQRNQRLLLTLISKQWVVFYVACAFLYYKMIPAETWAFMASVVLGANVFQKWKGVQPDSQVEKKEVPE